MAREQLQHVIVDGSNIATEGRDLPSLTQLDEAVQAFIREYEPEILTVVVDASFPNRIARSEQKVYEEAHSAGESDRERRRLHPADRRPGGGDGAVERLVSRVPRPVQVALRAGPAHRRQAGTPRGLGVHGP